MNKRILFLLFVGSLFAIPTLSAQGLFGNKEEPKITETDFKTFVEGTWDGEGSQLGVKFAMKAWYDAKKNHFMIQYPSLSCSGHWEITKITPKVITLREHITQGAGNCKKEADVKIRFVNEKELKVEFYEVNGLIPLATAKIYKKEPLKIENTVFKTLLTGVWEGEADQTTSKWLTQLQYDPQKNEFIVNYPTLSCGGTWRVNTVTENMLKLDEVITEGTVSNCIKEMDIYVYYKNDNILEVKFHRINAANPTASAVMEKKEKFAETGINTIPKKQGILSLADDYNEHSNRKRITPAERELYKVEMLNKTWKNEQISIGKIIYSGKEGKLITVLFFQRPNIIIEYLISYGVDGNPIATIEIGGHASHTRSECVIEGNRIKTQYDFIEGHDDDGVRKAFKEYEITPDLKFVLTKEDDGYER